MVDETEVPAPTNRSSAVQYVVIAVAALYVIASLYFLYDLRGRAVKLEQANQANAVAQKELERKLRTTANEMRAATETVAARVGMTEQDLQKSLSARAAQLERQQKAAEARIEQQHQQAMTKVTGEIAGVKTDVGSAKTDIASTRSDLEATKQKLVSVLGDLQEQSGLIARTRDDLDYLKHRGDRNYYEFTLTKSKHPTPVSNISLQLTKADRKKSRFTLNVIADDRTIEKKDRTVAEPLQFYSMANHTRQLYELVIFTVEKDKVTGYLSTPKTAK